MGRSLSNKDLQLPGKMPFLTLDFKCFFNQMMAILFQTIQYCLGNKFTGLEKTFLFYNLLSCLLSQYLSQIQRY